MSVAKAGDSEILLIDLALFEDSRGFFAETYQKDRYKKLGILEDFVQDNHCRAMKNSLRGFHYTCNKSQSQILTVISGLIYDVVVDLRRSSPLFGKWVGTYLGGKGQPRQIYMPHGFGHGYCVLSEEANLHYKASNFYDPLDERGLYWNDPAIAVNWPIDNPIVNERDSNFPLLSQINLNDFPKAL